MIWYGVDPYMIYGRRLRQYHQIYFDNMYLRVIRKVSRFGERFILVRKTSDEGVNFIPDNVDFVFIDGHHDENATLSYFRQILPFLSDNAILAFDDIHWSCGMERAWNKIRKDRNLKMALDFFNVGICIFQNKQ